MAKKDKRFDIIQTENASFGGPTCQILVDTATGIQYLFVQAGYAGGLTPLLDKDGTPLRWEE